MFFKHGNYSGKTGFWVVFGWNRRFRIDWKEPVDKDGWQVKVTRVATWRRNDNPPVFHTKEFTH